MASTRAISFAIFSAAPGMACGPRQSLSEENRALPIFLQASLAPCVTAFPLRGTADFTVRPPIGVRVISVGVLGCLNIDHRTSPALCAALSLTCERSMPTANRIKNPTITPAQISATAAIAYASIIRPVSLRPNMPLLRLSSHYPHLLASPQALDLQSSMPVYATAKIDTTQTLTITMTIARGYSDKEAVSPRKVRLLCFPTRRAY